ncbi:hypothetical protein DNTS_026173 [Danionella cerebrum]|uniref:non-specific serine/threonine protein kinase n=1 Tax=Danionella cerebrum TaxID=2873325 RepID=A0A553RI16_9TELE|nr:hypothetical protein DNTS_026173 [Danionella translucida]
MTASVLRWFLRVPHQPLHASDVKALLELCANQIREAPTLSRGQNPSLCETGSWRAIYSCELLERGAMEKLIWSSTNQIVNSLDQIWGVAQTRYVIKKLNLRASSRRERRAAEQEAQLLSQLKHPNIVMYRESWEGPDCQLYIVMGFCEGGDLYHRLKQQKGELLPERQVVEWFVQIAMALQGSSVLPQYLHEKHILHRDLKTQNIFLTKTNIIKVGDLGIARVLENQNDMASTLIGTPYYMSPELFSNKPYNYKSDVWALGCCVYEMATLKHAFNAKDMNSLAYRIVEGKLPQMPSKYDPQLGELIKRMLCKRPEDRPDVKHILRQPFIKHQISMFLEATKQKTSKSQKNSRGNSAGSNTSAKPNHEAQPQESKICGKKGEENSMSRPKICNGAVDNQAPKHHVTPRSPTPDLHSSTGQSLATISHIDLEIQCHDEMYNKAKPPPPEPNSHHNHKPPPVSRREKEDTSAPQKLRSGISRTEDWMSANGASITGKPADRSMKKAPARMDFKDDTLKLLQEVGMENVAFGSLELSDDNLSNASVMTDAATRSSAEEKEDSLDSTENLLRPLPVVEMEPAGSDSSRAVLHPSSSSSEPSVSRQRRQRRKNISQEENNLQSGKSVLRPLPPLPEDLASVAQKNPDKSRARETSSSNKSASEPQNHPLSARERRRLKQLQEISKQKAFRRGQSSEKHSDFHDKALEKSFEGSKRVKGTMGRAIISRRGDGAGGLSKSCQHQCGNNKASGMAKTITSRILESHQTHGTNPCTSHERTCWSRQSDEDECSSSTSSSTERSEGDDRERKVETCEMHDLVQMMTQTLHMDGRDVLLEPEAPHCRSVQLPEFKLNRKYRDTLMLHGKSKEAQGDFQITGFSLDDSTGPAKVRRVIEHLRTDVLKGLGVKLLDRVMDIMQEEEDEDARERLLQEQMGAEKYRAFAVKVRQLKFFEDVAFEE